MTSRECVDYYFVTVPDKPGEGLKVLSKVEQAGVNLLSMTAFPIEGGRTQIDLVPAPENAAALVKAAQGAGLALSPKKQAIFIQGKDRVGAVAEIFKKLADARVNVDSANASTRAEGAFALIVWPNSNELDAAFKAVS